MSAWRTMVDALLRDVPVPASATRARDAETAETAKTGADLGTVQGFGSFGGFGISTEALAERASLIEEGAKVPRGWAEGFATLEGMPPPAGVDPEQWLAVVNAAGSFLDQWGGAAAALGWTAGELFGLDPNAPLNPHDRRGAAYFLAGAEVLAITAEEITLRVGKDVVRVRRSSRHGVAPWEVEA